MKILSYIELGKQEGAKCLIGGERAAQEGDLKNGYYIKPTVFKGHNKMRIFQEEIFGPVVSVTTFKDQAEALEISENSFKFVIIKVREVKTDEKTSFQ